MPQNGLEPYSVPFAGAWTLESESHGSHALSSRQLAILLIHASACRDSVHVQATRFPATTCHSSRSFLNASLLPMDDFSDYRATCQQ